MGPLISTIVPVHMAHAPTGAGYAVHVARMGGVTFTGAGFPPGGGFPWPICRIFQPHSPRGRGAVRIGGRGVFRFQGVGAGAMMGGPIRGRRGGYPWGLK